MLEFHSVPTTTSKILLVQWGSRRVGFDSAGTVESVIQKACAHYRLDASTAQFALVGKVNGVYLELSDDMINHLENGSIVLLTRDGLGPTQSNFVSAHPSYYYGTGPQPMGLSSYPLYLSMYQGSLAAQAYQGFLPGLETIQVNVRTSVTGKNIPIKIHPLYTVLMFKHALQDKAGLPPDQQCLFFAGQQLEDAKRLADYNIQRDSTLHMLLTKAPGGKSPLRRRAYERGSLSNRRSPVA